MNQCLCRTLAQLEDEVAPCEAQMESWSNYLKVMAQKERQYVQQCANYEVLSLFVLRREMVLLDLVLYFDVF